VTGWSSSCWPAPGCGPASWRTWKPARWCASAPGTGCTSRWASSAPVRDAPTLDAAGAAADRFTSTFARDYPSAVACFTDDLEAILAIHRVPVRHRIRVRTTNLAERSFDRRAPPHQGHPPAHR